MKKKIYKVFLFSKKMKVKEHFKKPKKTKTPILYDNGQITIEKKEEIKEKQKTLI